jgi:hypothetical protein
VFLVNYGSMDLLEMDNTRGKRPTPDVRPGIGNLGEAARRFCTHGVKGPEIARRLQCSRQAAYNLLYQAIGQGWSG